MKYKFNVFGKQMGVYREGEFWVLYNESDTGIRSKVYDVVIPQELDSSKLAGYLDDIYHEYATDKHPSVVEKRM